MASETTRLDFEPVDNGQLVLMETIGGRVATAYSIVFSGIFNLPPGMTCDGHCRLETDNLFSRDAAEAILDGRKFQISMEEQQFRRSGIPFSRSRLLKMHEMVPLETDLYEHAVLEDVGGSIPLDVLQFYADLFLRSGVSGMNREIRMDLFNMLRGMPGCCVPAAILGSQLLRQKITLCRLGFRDPRKKNIYDWEYGQHGVRWV